MQIRTFRALALVSFFGVFVSTAWADQNAGRTTPIKMTPELKMDMADMYQKMAACLRTGKSVPECNQEVMKDCPVIKKTGHCPIIEGMEPILGK
jgi:hypothetical protein